MKKFHHGKTKVAFTFGIYVLFWRHKIRVWLRDDFGLAINPKREFWLTFVPFVNLIHWWQLLEEIKGAQKRAGMTEHLHVAHAFFLSAFWFASVPYVDKHLNALAEVRAGMGGHHKHGEFQPMNEWAKS
jgi:hypothetical protein